jgi:uncharacterized membrane protein YfcA
LDLSEIALLVGGGLIAGIVNTLAGGGSLLTIPLLVLIGLPGNVANGTNRFGILVQNLMAVWSFRAQGVSEFGSALPVLAPLALGAATGALGISQLPDPVFEKTFGVVMLLLLVPTFLSRFAAPTATAARPWSAFTSSAVFFVIGAYGGAFQAGVGIFLLLALSHAGFDLVRANAVKVLVVGAVALVALVVVIAGDNVAWLPAALLAVGFSIGGALGARLAVRGGERLIRPIVVIAVIALAARMLGLI